MAWRARGWLAAALGWLFCLVLLSAVPVCAWELHGFADLRSGLRLRDADHQRRALLNEARLQSQLSHYGTLALWQLRADLVADEAAPETELDLERGSGPLDLREAYVLLTPAAAVDVKLGRQILTWGTGDLLFINDLFPKDWQAFFLGRDEDYLKAPSDAALISLFFGAVTLDIAYMPGFEADRYISGERLSYFNPQLGRQVGRDAILQVDRRSRLLVEDEIALRLSRTLAGYELALYGYDGYWKNPLGFAPARERMTFPRLRVYGASLRGPLGAGLLHAEIGYYDSLADRTGRDPLLPNSEYRLLLGYECELSRDFTAALQYYLERLDAYGAYRRSLPAGQRPRDENRQLLTLRLTRQLLGQNLLLSLFTYYSPTDADGYVRGLVNYKATDALALFAGVNLFAGRHAATFFGQFEDNSNLYGGVRYSF